MTPLDAWCPGHGPVTLTADQLVVEVDDGKAWSCWTCDDCQIHVRERLLHGPALLVLLAAGVVAVNPLTVAEVDAFTDALDDDDMVRVHLACARREVLG